MTLRFAVPHKHRYGSVKVPFRIGSWDAPHHDFAPVSSSGCVSQGTIRQSASEI